VSLLSVLPLGTSGPTTEITGTSTFSRWQYELILYALVVAALVLVASFVYALATRSEVSKKYRTASMASALICGVAFLAYVVIIIQWFRGFSPNADSTSYHPRGGGVPITGLRYADWSVTVPLLTVELIAVCTVARSKAVWLRFSTMSAAFLMIVTGFLGVIAVGEHASSTTELLIWGAISTVFFLYLYPALLAPVRKTLETVSPETGTSLRNSAILLLSLWGVYPVVFLIPLWAGEHSAGWATTIQLSFTAADIAAKAGFGALVHKVAKLRTAEDAAEPAASVPEGYPAEVYVSGHLLSLPARADGPAIQLDGQSPVPAGRAGSSRR